MRTLIAALGLSLALAAPVAAAPAPAQTISISYGIHGMGMTVGRADYEFSFADQGYQGRSTRRATGFARSMLGSSQDFTYSVAGAVIGADKLQPTAYQHQGGKNGRVVRVQFTPATAVTTATPPMGMGNPAATEAQKVGVIDQVSLIAQMMVVSGDPCAQTLKIYMDGRARFDLTLTPDGRERVSVGEYRGHAQRCAVRMVPLAGFSDPQEEARLKFLFAPIGGYYAPVLVEMPTDSIVTIRLQATSVKVSQPRAAPGAPQLAPAAANGTR
jgi:hypothetical protein